MSRKLRARRLLVPGVSVALFAMVVGVIGYTSHQRDADAARAAEAAQQAHERVAAAADVDAAEQDWLRDQQTRVTRSQVAAIQAEHAQRIEAANATIADARNVASSANGKADPAALNAAIDSLAAAAASGVRSSIETASAAVAAQKQAVTGAIAAYDSEQARIAAEQAADDAAKQNGTQKPSSSKGSTSAGGPKSSGGAGTSKPAAPSSPSTGGASPLAGQSGPLSNVKCSQNPDGTFHLTFTVAGQTGYINSPWALLDLGAWDGMEVRGGYYTFTNPEVLAAACSG